MKLPLLLAKIAEATNEKVALVLAEAYGGCRVYIPSKARLEPCPENYWLIELVGLEDALKIADALAATTGSDFLIPSAIVERRRLEIRELIAADKPVREIARTVGCSERTVYFHKAAVLKEKSKLAPTKRAAPKSAKGASC